MYLDVQCWLHKIDANSFGKHDVDARATNHRFLSVMQSTLESHKMKHLYPNRTHFTVRYVTIKVRLLFNFLSVDSLSTFINLGEGRRSQ